MEKSYAKNPPIKIDNLGNKYQSSNFCTNPQDVCPRETLGHKQGEGYYLCKYICGQEAHTEVNVINFVKSLDVDLTDATIEVEHDWVCGGCKSQCEQHKLEIKVKGR